jgi:hypothetical protein
MIHQMMYSSHMRGDHAASRLPALLQQAQHNNAARGVTGVLLVVDDVFVQILEGDNKQVVTDLVRHIASDPRHDGLTVILEQEADRRSFTSWTMACLPTTANELARWASLDGATTITEVLHALQTGNTCLPDLALRIVAAMEEAG